MFRLFFGIFVATISVTLLTMLEKSFNQIDKDKRSQHYATLNRGRRGGCFNDLCHWLYMI